MSFKSARFFQILKSIICIDITPAYPYFNSFTQFIQLSYYYANTTRPVQMFSFTSNKPRMHPLHLAQLHEAPLPVHAIRALR